MIKYLDVLIFTIGIPIWLFIISYVVSKAYFINKKSFFKHTIQGVVYYEKEQNKK